MREISIHVIQLLSNHREDEPIRRDLLKCDQSNSILFKIVKKYESKS